MMPGRAVVTSSKHTTSDHATLVATVLVGLEGAVHVTSGGRLIASGPVVVVPPLLSVGLRNLMTGRDATSAAHMAGFADLAHFSRACRSSIGNSPSQFSRQLIR